MQLPRYMGIETSCLFHYSCTVYNCNFLVIWGLKRLYAVALRKVYKNHCNFLVIWGLKQLHPLIIIYIYIATSSLYGDWNKIFLNNRTQFCRLQLPRYMGIETPSSGSSKVSCRYCNFLVIWGLKHYDIAFNFFNLKTLQLPRYMGIETFYNSESLW